MTTSCAPGTVFDGVKSAALETVCDSCKESFEIIKRRICNEKLYIMQCYWCGIEHSLCAQPQYCPYNEFGDGHVCGTCMIAIKQEMDARNSRHLRVALLHKELIREHNKRTIPLPIDGNLWRRDLLGVPELVVCARKCIRCELPYINKVAYMKKCKKCYADRSCAKCGIIIPSDNPAYLVCDGCLDALTSRHVENGKVVIKHGRSRAIKVAANRYCGEHDLC